MVRFSYVSPPQISWRFCVEATGPATRQASGSFAIATSCSASALAVSSPHVAQCVNSVPRATCVENLQEKACEQKLAQTACAQELASRTGVESCEQTSLRVEIVRKRLAEQTRAELTRSTCAENLAWRSCAQSYYPKICKSEALPPQRSEGFGNRGSRSSELMVLRNRGKAGNVRHVTKTKIQTMNN